MRPHPAVVACGRARTQTLTHLSARVRMTNRAENSIMEVIKMQNRGTASAKVRIIKIQLASTFHATKVTASGT